MLESNHPYLNNSPIINSTQLIQLIQPAEAEAEGPENSHMTHPPSIHSANVRNRISKIKAANKMTKKDHKFHHYHPAREEPIHSQTEPTIKL